jgi:uncharacterized phage-associated protein
MDCYQICGMKQAMVDSLSPSSVSNFLLAECRERGELLTNLKLQKLLYYSQAWWLALHNKILFQEDFQAWVHGPVLPSEYQRFKEFQWRPITSDIKKSEFENDIAEFLSQIVDVFGSETAVSLELMTHRERPWIDARGNLAPHELSTAIISKKAMADFYRSISGNQ